MTGDAVNLASRIEGLNKQYRSRHLISEEVLRAAAIENCDAIDLGDVEIRGRLGNVRLFQLA